MKSRAWAAHPRAPQYAEARVQGGLMWHRYDSNSSRLVSMLAGTWSCRLPRGSDLKACAALMQAHHLLKSLLIFAAVTGDASSRPGQVLFQVLWLDHRGIWCMRLDNVRGSARLGPVLHDPPSCWYCSKQSECWYSEPTSGCNAGTHLMALCGPPVRTHP